MMAEPHRISRGGVVLAALALAVPVVVSGAAAAPGAVSPKQVVRSPDGGLTVTVPRGALRKHAKVRIRVLPRSQYPAELRDAAFRPGSRIYALEPAGLRFTKPVTVTRRLDVAVGGFDTSQGMPHLVLVSRDGNAATGKGRWTILGGHSSRLTGTTLVITAKLRHFSTVVTLDGRARVSMTPLEVEQVVGQTFQVDSRVVAEREYSVVEGGLTGSRWGTTGVLANVRADVVQRDAHYRLTVRCDRPGSGTYSRLTVLRDRSIERTLLAFLQGTILHEGSDEFEFAHSGTATCRAVAPPSLVEIVAACWLVEHKPFAGSPSSVALRLGTRDAPAGSRAEMRVGAVNGGNPVTGTVDAAGTVELRGGITSYGSKPVQSVGVAGTDVTQRIVQLAGPAVNVTATQGVVAGTCP
jgi:hypothetical protein